MTRKSIKQISWTGGQISDYAMSLQDHALGYETFMRSSREIKNAVILPTTGIKRRGGLRFVQKVNAKDDARLFFFHERLHIDKKWHDECFMIVVSDTNIEIFTCDGSVITPKETFNQIVLNDFTLDRLSDIKIAYTANSVLFVHGEFPPKKLTLKNVKDKTDWEISNIVFTGVKFDDPVSGSVGYPKNISTISSRLILAGTEVIPHGIWFSKVDETNNESNLFDFTVGTKDTDAINKYLSVKNLEILDILAVSELFILTNVGILITNQDYTPKGLDFRLAVETKIIGNPHAFYLENKRFFFSGNVLESFSYSRQVQSYVTSQVSSMFARMNAPDRTATVNKKDNHNADMLFFLSPDRKLQVLHMVKQLTQSEVLDGVALSEWSSELEFIDIESNNDHDLYFLAKDKKDNINILIYDENHLLDYSTQYEKTNFSSDYDFKNRIDYLNDQSVGIVADNMWFGENNKVSNGKIAEFSDTIKNNVEVGIPYYFSIERIIPFSSYVFSVALSETNILLYNTSSLEVKYKNHDIQVVKKPIPIPLDNNNLISIAKEKIKFSGSIANTTDDISIKWYQKVPLHVNIMSIEYIFYV